jgi:uncharacterized protein
VVLLILIGCAENGAPTPSASATPAADGLSPDASSFDKARALIDTDGGSLFVNVEIADTPAKREQGLMGRESLDEDSGMVFIFFEPSSSPFWMKDTLIPLSIAFFDDEGDIVDILDMDPCKKEPCPFYTPAAPYFGALEVNQGAFEDWGVEVGDRITVAR